MKSAKAPTSKITNKSQVFLRPEHYVEAKLVEGGMASYVRIGDEIVGATGDGRVVYFHIKN